MNKIEDVSLKTVFCAIWSSKWKVLALTGLITLISIYIAIRLPNIYKSEVVLAPTAESSSVSLPGQLGGLASLAGVDLGNGNSGNTTLALELLKSRYFISNFIEKYDLAIPLFGANGWDHKADALTFDSDIYDGDTGTWIREQVWPRESHPSKQELYEAFLDVFQITINEDSGYLTISIEHYSPYLAKTWLTLIVEDINREMRLREVSEAEKSIEFLNEQVKNTNIADAKKMLYSLIEEQTKTLMLANSRAEFVFKTVDPAVVAEEKVKPQRALIVVLAMLLGLMLSTLIILTKTFLTRDYSD